MSDASGPGTAGAGAGEAKVHKERLSIIWLIPLVAVGIGIWLAYQTYSEKGPTITISFAEADGLDAGKSKVKYKGINVGDVGDISLDGKNVIVTVEMHPGAKSHLNDQTLFWVVKPRVTAGGVSGLGTLLSGNYIGMRPGDGGGKQNRAFVGAEGPPIGSRNAPGVHIKFEADALNSLGPQSPIYYREIQVGAVQDHELADDGRSVVIHALIKAPYHKLVREKTRFYNVGGIHASVGFQGVDVDVESLDALLSGGIAFETPAGDAGGKQAENGATYQLLDSQQLIEKARAGDGLHLVLESEQTGSVEAGDHVYYRELPVGVVTSVALALDSRKIRTDVSIHWPYANLVHSTSKFWNASGISADLGLSGLKLQTESLEALIAGGVAFATPDARGHRVTSGSVFALHGESKPEWRKWSPLIWRGDPAKAPKIPVAAKKEGAVKGTLKKAEHGIAAFFHHEDKPEEQTKQEHAEHEEHKKKHGFWGGLFHHDDNDDDKKEDDKK
jgi:paraquat-inducible protein B